jgi:pyrroline-5-carboxylate reductase
MSMNTKYGLGFIGAGNMAAAMLNGILKNKLYKPEDIIVYDTDKAKLNWICSNTEGIKPARNNKSLAESTELIILAVKPNYIEDVLKEIKEVLTENHTLISIAAGVKIDFLREKIGGRCRIIRTMPNTPAMVGEGMTAICRADDIPDEIMIQVKRLFKAFGRVEYMEEKMLNAATALSGSSPAYVFMMIEAMADGGVLMGLPRDLSYRLSAQAVLGAAKMVLESGRHPAELKDIVCSPGGTTIEAMRVLENNGMRNAIIEAVKACTEKGNQLGKGK